jgi:archaellum biogenesis protein FlaJ (TadC family)
MEQSVKERKMKLSLRITLTLTVIIVMGIITFIKIMTKAGAFPTAYFIIWMVVSIVLIGITVWSWLQNKKK